MAVYEYWHVDKSGKRKKGIVEALSEIEAKSKLREQGLFVLKLHAKAKSSKRENLKGEQLLTFTLQLSQLINAGVPLYESLTAIEEQSRGDPYHRILLNLCEQIHSGSSLSSAMAAHPDSFDRLYCGMIAAGEAVGSLGVVLEKLSQFLARSIKLKKQITTAMIYPVILGGFSLLIIAVLLGFVVPSLEGIFSERQLNGFTAAVFAFSHFFREYWWVYLPFMLLVFFFSVWQLQKKESRDWRERAVLKIPLIKTIVIQTAVARFCRTMGTLLQGGVSMIDSLRIARGVIKNVAIEKEIQIAEGKIIEGRSLSQELKRSRYFPQLVFRMLAVGEESGTTTIMLSRIADMYEAEIEKTLDRIMALAQPLILIVMGLVIGTVLLAILLPLTDVSSFSIN